jgi:hypothetical protein
MCVVRSAAARELDRRFLLRADADRLVALAEAADILPFEAANDRAKAVAEELCR